MVQSSLARSEEEKTEPWVLDGANEELAATTWAGEAGTLQA